MKDQKFVPEKKLKYLYYRIEAVIIYLIECMFPPRKVHYKEVPVIINNFNRVTTLKKLISCLEERGYYNIYILDNKSSYPPLLDYYNECKYKVFRLNENLGALAFWKSGIYKQFRKSYFVYTDSDVMPVENCPADFMEFFLKTMKKHRLAQKVGFSLKIDDIPDHYLQKPQVLKNEEQFYKFYNEEENLYRAPVDTTFALYRPRARFRHANNYIEIYRTGFPYMAYHLPWYHDSLNPEPEERYYIETCGPLAMYTKESKKYISGDK
jgi:glycosyltransferase involved in cell wall biosynthesis